MGFLDSSVEPLSLGSRLFGPVFLFFFFFFRCKNASSLIYWDQNFCSYCSVYCVLNTDSISTVIMYFTVTSYPEQITQFSEKVTLGLSIGLIPMIFALFE